MAPPVQPIFPTAITPLVDEEKFITPTWRYLLQELWQRAGLTATNISTQLDTIISSVGALVVRGAGGWQGLVAGAQFRVLRMGATAPQWDLLDGNSFGAKGAGTFFAGPSAGPAAVPTFRAISDDDFGAQAANLVFAGPTTGAAASPAFRAEVLADLPTGIITFKLVTFTRDLSTASGTQAVTGVGFQPKALVMFAIVATGSGTSLFTSHGLADTTLSSVVLASLSSTTALWQVLSPNIVRLFVDNTNTKLQEAVVTSYDADGFTLTWTKTSTPTGTATMYALCLGGR